MKELLTARQKDVFEYMRNYIAEIGYAPSVREVCDALNLKSTSTAHAHLTQLEKKGYIYRNNARPRTTTILHGQDPRDERCSERMIRVPVVGNVAAGVPITAVENIEEYVTLPHSMLGEEDVFILNVKGDSMIDAGILDNDRIIARKQGSAQNGDIVVAMLDEEATVKRFFREEDSIRLQPENENYEPIYSKEVDVLGKVIGVLRMF
jgi:repressor LexA